VARRRLHCRSGGRDLRAPPREHRSATEPDGESL
jgi:hypothetical protein